MESKFKLPTETVELPSRGLIYPEDHPLANGTVEMKYMTAREEDILTNQNYIKKGTVIDKLLQSLITSDISYDDLLVGDKNAIMIAARILSYGKDYDFNLGNGPQSVDLSLFENKIFSISETVDPNTATIPPSPFGTAFCIASPLIFKSLIVSENPK